LNQKPSTTCGAARQKAFARSALQTAILLLVAGAAQAQTAAAAADSQELQTVVVTGLRGIQRSQVDAPIPLDVVPAAELTKTGQLTLDKAMQFIVPSFNTVQTPVNDATSLLDPYEIRNMGPSRSLILINGKRKNSSALVYTQTSPGRGETGADLSAIPQDAIKRIEVVRDGASAQYGSDAIAGVVNIILKDDPKGTSITGRTGVTGKGDGQMYSASVNHGMSLGGSGFANFTVESTKTELASRSGIVSALGEADTFGADLATVQAFLAKKPDAGNINGSPATRANKFLVNASMDVSSGVSIYGNAAYVDKTVDSFANYRTPYWKTTDYGLLHAPGTTYEGFVPTFLGALKDYNATLGSKFDLGGWDSDVSVTLGGNEQRYTVTNTINYDLGAQSPTRFDAGGVRFSHVVVNGDFSKDIGGGTSAYFGTELRDETFESLPGDPASYYGAGANSYAGNSPANSGKWSRTNYGVYGGATFQPSKQLTVDAIARYEHYSDFGSATIGKLSSLYKVDDSLSLRGSVSTGFRAPSLHQIYTSKAQYSFVNGQIQVSGIANNVSDQAAALGVPHLKPEKSTSFTLGMGFKPDRDTTVTVDYYNIRLKDRILLGNAIGPTGDPKQPLDQILNAAGIVNLAFFTNAMDSTTSGIDYVFTRRNIPVGQAKMTVNLSGNYTIQNERDGAVHDVPSVAAAGQSVLDATQEALLLTSRPKYKTILGFDLDYRDFSVTVNNTMFGPTTFRNAGMDPNLSVVFATKVVTDFSINYQISKGLTLAFNINNILDVIPSWKFVAVGDTAKGQALLDSTTKDASGRTPRQVQTDIITFDGRYPIVTYDGSQFSQLGRTFSLALNYRF
jgi:iron complex outermembrane receptor protein